MDPKPGAAMHVDSVQFSRNVRKFPREELVKYVGQVIAWSGDGTQIVAHAPTTAELFAVLDQRNITEYVIDGTLSDDAVSPAPK